MLKNFVLIFFFVGLTAIEATAFPQTAAEQKAIDALKSHLTQNINRLGLPRSYIPVSGYDPVLPYPDRCYVFDLGALLAYAGQDDRQWGKYITPVVDVVLKLQNKDGMWARAYDDFGIAEDGLYAGPAAVLARGLLNWSKARGPDTAIGEKALSGALKTAGWLLKDINKIKVSGYDVIKQVTGPRPGSASPEENARAALFFIDLYVHFMEAGQKTKSLQQLKAAESILAGICSLRKELYPFGISEHGSAVWEMPDREGVEGQCAMLQALYAYLTITRKEDRTSGLSAFLENDFAKRNEILAWVEKTHRHQNSRFTDIGGKKVLIPLSFSKKIGPDGNAAPHAWLEFMARMALTYRYAFHQENEYGKLISGMATLQHSSGFFPYAVAFNGYKTLPAWPLGSEQQDLNFPFGSLIATIEFLFACQNAAASAYQNPFAKFP